MATANITMYKYGGSLSRTEKVDQPTRLCSEVRGKMATERTIIKQ